LILDDNDMTKKLKLGVLISGSGSNLQSIIDHIDDGRLSAEIKIVISNNPGAFGINRAKKHGIPFAVVDSEKFTDREEFDRQLVGILSAAAVDLIVLAGFMRILSPFFLQAFPQRIINIHPALLPAFPGIHVQKKALDYGVKFSGCTVHFVDEGVDTGPIIIQSVVPVFPDDDEETLSKRILKEEHRIYPQAIQFFAEGRIMLSGRKVQITNVQVVSVNALHNPPLTAGY